MPIVAQGGDLTLDALVRNGASAPCDATDLAVAIYTLAGALVDGPFVEPAISHLALGQYRYIWAVPDLQAIGTYEAKWSGKDNFGATVLGDETFDVVEPGSILVGPLDFLVKPDDYDGVRNLLGVTVLDLPDETIEMLPFAPHAEILVKAEIVDWEDIPMDDPRWMLLRLGTAYATAALIAESNAKGGFLGLVRGEGSRSAADWDSIAKTFWSYFQRLVDQGEDPYGQEMVIGPWMVIAHHSRVPGVSGQGPEWGGGGYVGNLYPEGWF
jgi:hypothetical protein